MDTGSPRTPAFTDTPPSSQTSADRGDADDSDSPDWSINTHHRVARCAPINPQTLNKLLEKGIIPAGQCTLGCPSYFKLVTQLFVTLLPPGQTFLRIT